MDYSVTGDVETQAGVPQVSMQRVLNSYHALRIAGLMYFNPAKFFHKINSLTWYHGVLQTWTDSLGYQKVESILEVGCATGELAKHLAGQGAIVIGVDNSTRMLQKANESKIEGTRFEHASAMALPFERKYFDHVISASLINIISEPELALREMVRVCKPGGKISVLVPQAGMTDESVSKLAHELDLTGFSRAALFAWHRRAPKMQRERLHDYFKDAGLSNICTATYLSGMVMSVTGEYKRVAEHEVTASRQPSN